MAVGRVANATLSSLSVQRVAMLGMLTSMLPTISPLVEPTVMRLEYAPSPEGSVQPLALAMGIITLSCVALAGAGHAPQDGIE
jgi:hypothetical protein